MQVVVQLAGPGLGEEASCQDFQLGGAPGLGQVGVFGMGAVEQPVHVIAEVALAGANGFDIGEHHQQPAIQGQRAVGDVGQDGVGHFDGGGFVAVHAAA